MYVHVYRYREKAWNHNIYINMVYRYVVADIKGMILLTFIIRPWPPDDFGTLVDSQTFAVNSIDNGLDQDGFMMYTKAIFGKDILKNANYTPKPKVSLCIPGIPSGDRPKPEFLLSAQTEYSAPLPIPNIRFGPNIRRPLLNTTEYQHLTKDQHFLGTSHPFTTNFLKMFPYT
jgi:hypothetical protein